MTFEQLKELICENFGAVSYTHLLRCRRLRRVWLQRVVPLVSDVYKRQVSKLVPAEGVSEDELIELAAYGEAFATHPIGKSILEAAKGKAVSYTHLIE